MRIQKPVFLLIMLLALLPPGAEAGEAECPKGMALPAEKELSIAGRKLTTEQHAKLKQLFASLRCIQREVYPKPEILIHYPSDTEDNHLGTFSVFLREGYIYPGYFLDAWHDRMVGRSSKVYEIDDATRVFFSQFTGATLKDNDSPEPTRGGAGTE